MEAWRRSLPCCHGGKGDYLKVLARKNHPYLFGCYHALARKEKGAGVIWPLDQRDWDMATIFNSLRRLITIIKFTNQDKMIYYIE